jgi:hypothetical protein
MARGVEKRQRVCAVEFNVEMLGKDLGDKEINIPITASKQANFSPS